MAKNIPSYGHKIFYILSILILLITLGHFLINMVAGHKINLALVPVGIIVFGYVVWHAKKFL